MWITKLFFFPILLLAIGAIRSAHGADDVREFCRAEWQNDFAMQKFCIEKQNDAKNWINSAVDASDQEDKQVLDRCRSEWPGDHAMTKFCIEKQVQGILEVNRLVGELKGQSEGDIIFSECRKRWSDQFGVDAAMMAYCMGQQKRALDSINSGG